MNREKLICKFCGKHIGWGVFVLSERISPIACLYCEAKLNEYPESG